MGKKTSSKKKTKEAFQGKAADMKHSPSLSSAWEVQLEPSSHKYDDALFADEAALDEAIKKAQTHTKKTAPTQTRQATPEEANPPDIDIDFSRFLTPDTKAGKFTLSEPCIKVSDTPLKTIADSINHLSTHTNLPKPPKIPFVIRRSVSDDSQSDQNQSIAQQSSIPFITKIRALVKHCKRQIAEYSGRTLPARDLSLDFSSATLKSKKEFENIPSTASVRKFFSYKASPALTVFKRADEQLADIARCDLKHSQKNDLLDTYSMLLSEKFRVLISSLERKPSAPGDIKRFETCKHALNAIKNLINGYRQIYVKMYSLPNYLYALQRKKINRCAYRIIDLLYLEQRLLTSLQRSLPTGSAKLMNKLYNALAMYEPELLEQQFNSLSLNNKSSINTLFIHYQIVMCIDMKSLSTLQHSLIYRYIQHHVPLLLIKPSAELAHISGFWLEVSHNDSGSASLVNSLTNSAEPCTYIYIHQFLNTIKKDFNECLDIIGQSNLSHSSKILAELDGKQALAAMSALDLSVCYLQNRKQPPAFTVYQAVEKKAYSEFNNANAYLTYYYYQLKKSLQVKAETVKNTLLKPKVSINHWLLAMEDEHSLHLQTTESKSNLKLDVGELVLFVNNIDEQEHHEQERHQLTYITRLERIQENKLNLVTEKLGDKVVPVTLVSTNGKPRPGLISVCDQQYLLIIQNDQDTFTGQTIAISLPDSSEAVIAVNQLKYLSHKLQVFSLL